MPPARSLTWPTSPTWRAELRQDYPGARLDDVNEAAIRRALGRQAVDDMDALRRPNGNWSARATCSATAAASS